MSIKLQFVWFRNWPRAYSVLLLFVLEATMTLEVTARMTEQGREPWASYIDLLIEEIDEVAGQATVLWVCLTIGTLED